MVDEALELVVAACDREPLAVSRRCCLALRAVGGRTGCPPRCRRFLPLKIRENKLLIAGRARHALPAGRAGRRAIAWSFCSLQAAGHRDGLIHAALRAELSDTNQADRNRHGGENSG